MQVEPTGKKVVKRPGVSRSQVILLGANAAQLALALLLTVLLGRVLAPVDYGFFVLVGTIFVIARELLDLGTGNVAAREIVRDPAREQGIIEGLMGWRRLLGAALAVVVAAMALASGDAGRGWVLAGAAAMLCFMSPGALYPVFQVRQAQGAPALLGIGSQVLLVAGSVCLYLLKAPGVLFAALIVLREATNMAGVKALGLSALGYRPKPGLRGRGLRPFLAMAVLYGLAALMHELYFHSDVLVVWALRGEAELGAYAAAFRPINPLLALPWVLMIPMAPMLSSVAARDRTVLAHQAGGSACLALGIGALGAVAGVMLAPDLIALLYGGNYLAGWLSAVNAFRWLSVAVGFVFVTPVLATALLADGRERWLLVLSLLGLLFNVGANLILVPQWGFTAAAAVTAATELLVCLGAVLMFHKAVGGVAVRVRWAWVLLPAAAVGLVLPAVQGTHGMRVACGVALGAAGAAVLLSSPAARRLRRAIAEAETGWPYSGN